VILNLTIAVWSKLNPIPGLSGTSMLPSLISIVSLNSGENQGMCSIDKQFGSDADIYEIEGDSYRENQAMKLNHKTGQGS
jgi:hypothetical protein